MINFHIRIKTYKLIALRFWIKSGTNPLCVSLTHVSLLLYLPSDPFSEDPIVVSEPKVCAVTNLDNSLYRKFWYWVG